MENWFIWIILVLTVFVFFGFLIKQNLDSKIKIAFENEKKKSETKKEIKLNKKDDISRSARIQWRNK